MWMNPDLTTPTQQHRLTTATLTTRLPARLVPFAFLVMLSLILGGTALAQEHNDGSRAETDKASTIPLDPSRGKEIGFVYQAYLSPQQEGGEEEETPAFIPPELRSSAPSVPRNQRTSRGHGVVEFTNDLSKAYAYLAVENVNPDDVVLLHLHCGRPGQLGPIIVDFALIGDINAALADGTMAFEIVNEDLVATANHGSGPIAAFTAGCPIVPAVPMDRIRTIAGMKVVADEGELYFNLHTKGQTYFGDIRGQLSAIEIDNG